MSPRHAPVDSSSAAAPPAEAAQKTVKRNVKKNVSPDEFGGPKRPASGYFIMCNEKRDGVVNKLKSEAEASGGKFAITDVGKTLAEFWKGLDDAGKKVYNEKAVVLKKKYEEENEAWKKTDQYKEFLKEVASHKKKQGDEKAKKAVQDAGMPKRPMSANLMFSGEKTAQVIADLKAAGQPITMKDRSNKIQEMWRALGAEGQQEYKDKAKAAKEQYEADLAAFKETDEYKIYEKTLEKNKKKKSDGDKLAKTGGVKVAKRAAAGSSTSKAAKKQKVSEDAGVDNSATDGADAEDKVFDSEEDNEDQEEEEESPEEDA